MKIEIEIPDPPDGWVYTGYRRATPGEMIYPDTTSDSWEQCDEHTVYPYPVCVKAKPLWEPLPELVAMLLDGWITRDRSTRVVLHSEKPFRESAAWDSKGSQLYLHCVRPEMLPPVTIPWKQSCFKIGDPKE
jgi:hypothetical protein